VFLIKQIEKYQKIINPVDHDNYNQYKKNAMHNTPILMKFNMGRPPRRNNMNGRLGYNTQKLHPSARQSADGPVSH